MSLLKSEKNPISALNLFDSATHHPSYTHTDAILYHILHRLSLSIDSKLLLHVTRIVDLIRTQKCPFSKDTVLVVMKAYSKNSMVDKAMELFQKMREIFGCEPGVRSYNTLLNAFVVSNQLSKAELFFRNFETLGVAPNLETSGPHERKRQSPLLRGRGLRQLVLQWSEREMN
ncbi:Hypothetical predicted protein [Olea europaea subsp. europaea]|uniref:Pentatricopeptide repeat-containing protein n=1 Tax=Olea europaea subsp. europaea TaxID=158383 RepID=A0A8S0QAF9_OLEEU|nr:Hypothetical predicted protein [Olea europaea subsp. europaea]